MVPAAPTHWILHVAVLGDRVAEARAALDALGLTYELHEGRLPLDWTVTPPPGRPVAALVTLQAARRLRLPVHRALVPGVFLTPERFRQAHYTAFLGDLMLNDDQVFLPWAEFVRRGARWLSSEQGRSGHVFVRPDSGFKVFTGQTLAVADLEREAYALAAVTSIVPETLVGVSAPKPVAPLEWRFWIVDGRIVTASAYSWEDGAGAAGSPPAAAVALAEAVAARAWQVDRAYVADVAMVDGAARLLELNSASTAGVYQADLTALFAAMSEAAAVEFTAL